MMMKISFFTNEYCKSSIKRQSGGLIYFMPILRGGGLIETGGSFEREGDDGVSSP